MGILYMNGQGVKQSQGEAVNWFKKAAKNGDENARNALIEIQSR